MKKTFSVLLLTLVMGTNAYAENTETKSTFNSQKPVSCMTPARMIEIVDTKYGEKPYIQGDGISPTSDGKQFIRTQLVFAVNLKTFTFSVVEIINPKLACIIAGGDNFRINNLDSKKTNASWEN